MIGTGCVGLVLGMFRGFRSSSDLCGQGRREDRSIGPRAHDHVGPEQARRKLPDVDDPYLCARGAHVPVLMTEWVQFRALDVARLKREMAQRVMVDLRNIYRTEGMAALGFACQGIGRAADVK